MHSVLNTVLFSTHEVILVTDDGAEVGMLLSTSPGPRPPGQGVTHEEEDRLGCEGAADRGEPTAGAHDKTPEPSVSLACGCDSGGEGGKPADACPSNRLRIA